LYASEICLICFSPEFSCTRTWVYVCQHLELICRYWS